MTVKEFLSSHAIIQTGVNLEKYLCCETIVDDPIGLVRILAQSEYYISSILWWDRVRMNEGSIIGYGGVVDRRFPEYFFAETDICEEFAVNTTAQDYLAYLQRVKEQYSQHDLHPSFDILAKRDRGEAQVFIR